MGSASEKCTMYSDKNLINRRNVKSDVTSAVNACRKFFEIEIEARVVAAGLCVLELDDMDGDPKHNTCDALKLFEMRKGPI